MSQDSSVKIISLHMLSPIRLPKKEETNDMNPDPGTESRGGLCMVPKSIDVFITIRH
jgi:hypothetical protein